VTTLSHIDTEAARLAPDVVFHSPDHLAAEPALTRGQKIAALDRWASDVKARLAAGSEGMPTNGRAPDDVQLLEKIAAARKSLADR
jgi:hypothetical protein